MKPLKFDETAKNAVLAGFLEFLDGIKDTPDKINYSKAITDFMPKKTPEEKEQAKARLIFTATAYMKTLLLIKDTTDEIGWHGIVERLDERTFKVTDILVFPQIVTAANVDPDAEEYAMWTMGLPDEEFNKMRFHGHSHVRMPISPSMTDTRYREDMMPNLGDDDYYIFMIINYDEKRNIEIFDKAKNIVYETEDVSVYVCDDQNNDIMGWVKIQEQKVKKKTYGTTTHASTTTQTDTKTTGTNTAASETDKALTIHTRQAPGEIAYWSRRMNLWVYEDRMGNKMFATIPPKTAIPNPNPEDDTFVTRKEHEDKKKYLTENEKDKKDKTNKTEKNPNTANGTNTATIGGKQVKI